MKKFILLIAAILCLTSLSSCAKEPDFFGVSVLPVGDASPGLYQTTFHFDSYDEMIKDFRKYDISKSSYTIQDLIPKLGEPYSVFVERVKADKSFPRPMLGGKEMTYRNKEGFSNITFFVSELYDLPWVWYFPSVSTGENFYIKMTYLPSGIEAANASEAIRALSPGSPNIDNLGSRHKSIYNKQIKLRDREVTALVIEYNDDPRDSTIFLYGGLIVEVRHNPAVWSDEWFSGLSFE